MLGISGYLSLNLGRVNKLDRRREFGWSRGSRERRGAFFYNLVFGVFSIYEVKRGAELCQAQPRLKLG